MATYPGPDTYPGLAIFPLPSDTDFEDWRAFQATNLTSLDVDQLDVGTEYEIQVRAVSTDGVASDWTESIFFVTPVDIEPPPVPSDPIVETRLGAFGITWDGKTQTGGTMPPDFAHCNVYAGDMHIGTIRVPSDKVVWVDTVEYDLEYDFTLASVDTSDNESERSGFVRSAVQAIVDTDFIGKVVSGIDNIINDSIGPSQIAANAIYARNIVANAVTAEKIAALSVTAGKIAANAITADKISAGAIDGMEITGNVIRGGTFYSLGRTAYNDTQQGWYIANDGLANVHDSAGNTIFQLNPEAGNQYAYVGGSENRMIYRATTGRLDIGPPSAPTFSVEANGNTTIRGSLTVTDDGPDISPNFLAIGSRSSYDDNGTGWYFSESGYANVKTGDGTTFMIVNPKDATKYVQIGDTASGSYLRYDHTAKQLTLSGDFASGKSGDPHVRLSNNLFGSPIAGMAFNLNGTTVGYQPMIYATLADGEVDGYAKGTLVLRSSQQSSHGDNLQIDRTELYLSETSLFAVTSGNDGTNASFFSMDRSGGIQLSTNKTLGLGSTGELALTTAGQLTSIANRIESNSAGTILHRTTNDTHVQINETLGIELNSPSHRMYLKGVDGTSASYSYVVCDTSNGRLYLSNSISALKADQSSIGANYAVLDLEGRTWVDKETYEADPDGDHWRNAGFVAEQVADASAANGDSLDPLLQLNGDGELVGVAYDRVVAYLVGVIRDMNDRLSAVEGSSTPQAQRVAKPKRKFKSAAFGGVKALTPEDIKARETQI